MIVVLDLGHGGLRTGAAANGLIEKNLVLDAGLICRDKLLQYENVEVIMTRTTDVHITLEERCKLANDAKADVFVSIHVNGANNPSVTGTEAFYRQGDSQGQALASYVQAEMLKKWSRRNRGIKVGNFHVLRETRMTSILTENDFLTNVEAANIMKRRMWPEEYADCIVAGLVQMYGLKKKSHPKPKEEKTMLENATLINSFADFPAAEPLVKRFNAPIHLPGMEIRAKNLYVVGGERPANFSGNVIMLSGTNRFKTASKVEKELMK